MPTSSKGFPSGLKNRETDWKKVPREKHHTWEHKAAIPRLRFAHVDNAVFVWLRVGDSWRRIGIEQWISKHAAGAFALRLMRDYGH